MLRKIMALLMTLLLTLGMALAEDALPISQDGLELKIYVKMVGEAATIMDSYEDHPIVKEMERQTGLNLTFIHPPAGDEATYFSTLLASGDYPDIYITDMFEKSYPGGAEGAIKDGILMDINALVQEHASNFWNKIDHMAAYAKKAIYSDGGYIVKFGAQIYGPDFVEGRTSDGVLLRKDLLEQTGLEAPVTIEDWDAVLRAFKDMGVEVPLAMKQFSSSTSRVNAFAGAYGVSIRDFQINDGKVVYGAMLDGYKDFMALLRGWMEDGLMDREFITRSDDDTTTMFYNGRAGAIVGGAYMATTALSVAPEEIEGYDVMGCVSPRLNEEDQATLVRRAWSLSGNAGFVSATCKHPVEAVKFIDYLYGDDAILLCAWGMGHMDGFDTYVVNEETGYREYSEYMKNNGSGLQYNRAIYTLQPLMMMYLDEPEYANYSLPQHKQIFEAFSWNRDDSQRLPAHLTLSAEESTRLNEIMNVIYTYSDEAIYKFILGETNLDEFDVFRQKMTEFGIEEACSIYQAAYDRYMAR